MRKAIQKLRKRLGNGEDDGGAVYVEYLTLTVTVSVVAALAIASLGPPMYRAFNTVRSMILLPFP